MDAHFSVSASVNRGPARAATLRATALGAQQARRPVSRSHGDPEITNFTPTNPNRPERSTQLS
jgi:hypothetical protein